MLHTFQDKFCSGQGCFLSALAWLPPGLPLAASLNEARTPASLKRLPFCPSRSLFQANGSSKPGSKCDAKLGAKHGPSRSTKRISKRQRWAYGGSHGRGHSGGRRVWVPWRWLRVGIVLRRWGIGRRAGCARGRRLGSAGMYVCIFSWYFPPIFREIVAKPCS